MTTSPMRRRDFLRWVRSHCVDVRWGKGGEIVLTKGTARRVLNGRAKEVGPAVVADTARRFGITP